MPVKELSGTDLENKFRLAISWRNAQIDFLGQPSFAEEKPVALADIYVAVRFSWGQGERGLFLADALKQSRHLVVLGGPGSGKSTLVKMIAYSFGRTQPTPLSKMLGTHIPIPIVLRDYKVSAWSGPKDMLTDFIQALDPEIKEFVTVNWLLDILAKGRGALLIDGIDEIGSTDHRLRFRDQVVSPLLQRSAKSLAVLTSRVVGYDEAPFDADPRRRHGSVVALRRVPSHSDALHPADRRSELAHISEPAISGAEAAADAALPEGLASAHRAYLLPFGELQIREYIHRWYEAREARLPDRSDKEKSLAEAILSSERLRELAATPALLSLMALVHRATGRLPEQRLNVYNKIVEAYLIETYRGLSGFKASLDEMKRWLGRVGYEMQRLRTDEHGIEVDSGQVIEWLRDEGCIESPKDFLDYVLRRSGLLVGAVGGNIGFTHLSLQEYFAAFHLRGWIRDFNRVVVECSDWAGSSIWHESLAFAFEMLAEFPGAVEDLVAGIVDELRGKGTQQQAAAFFLRMGAGLNLGPARDSATNLVLSAASSGDIPGSNRQLIEFLDTNGVDVAVWLREHGQDLGAGEGSPIAKALDRFARVFWEEGRFDDAQTLAKRALEIRTEALGPEYPDVADSLRGLADLYWYSYNLDAALEYTQRALAIYEKAYGPDHPEVARDANNIGQILQAQGDRRRGSVRGVRVHGARINNITSPAPGNSTPMVYPSTRRDSQGCPTPAEREQWQSNARQSGQIRQGNPLSRAPTELAPSCSGRRQKCPIVLLAKPASAGSPSPPISQLPNQPTASQPAQIKPLTLGRKVPNRKPGVIGCTGPLLACEPTDLD